jgi:putative ABC transport system substrate-binding protein
MKRRSVVIAALACGAAARLTVAAQPATRLYRIGVLRFGVPGDEARPGLTAALEAVGYREGQTVQVEWRWATSAEVAHRHAVELSGMGLDLIVASATPAAVALHAVNPKVPIVLAGVADPVGSGLVATLARPGGNITGVSNNLPALVPKQLQLLREAVPGLQRTAFLGSTEDRATPLFVEQARVAAMSLGLSMQPVLIGQAAEFEAAAATMARGNIQAVVVQPLFTLGSSGPLADVLIRHRLPSVSALRQFAGAGGLMSFGPNRTETWNRAASFIDRVLRGSKPAELPVEEPTLYDLVLNLKTARSIGLAIPASVRQRADEVLA